MGRRKKSPKLGGDAAYYDTRGSRPIAYSTVATMNFLSLVHTQYPELTIRQLRDLITDKREYILNPETVAVLDAHIKKGHGDEIPAWRYGRWK